VLAAMFGSVVALQALVLLLGKAWVAVLVTFGWVWVLF